MEPKPGPEKDASKRADKKRCRKYLLGMILGLYPFLVTSTRQGHVTMIHDTGGKSGHSHLEV
jgi:hypothetical protein